MRRDLKLHVTDLSIEWIHQEIKVAVELDEVFTRHDDTRVHALVDESLHRVPRVVGPRLPVLQDPGERQIVHQRALGLPRVGEAEGRHPDLALHRVGQRVEVVRVAEVVELQPRVDPLHQQDEVHGVGELQSGDLGEGEDGHVHCHLKIQFSLWQKGKSDSFNITSNGSPVAVMGNIWDL